MRKAFIQIYLLLLCSVIIIPLVMMAGFRASFFREAEPVEDAGGIVVEVYDVDRGRLETMELEDYVFGVVGAEMPLSFHPEALKAQAVAARTYVLNQKEEFGGQGCSEYGGDVCTDYRHCQDWNSVDDLKLKWGVIDFLRYWTKLSRVIDETEKVVLVHEGQLADVYYHSSSGGRTESVEEVWGGGYVPYLQSVESKWDKMSPYYKESRYMSFQEIDRRLGTDLNFRSIIKAEDIREYVQVVSHTSTGRISGVRLGDKYFTGSELRKKLDLRSTDIKFEFTEGGINFITSGYGHGVGMSQYGAEGMASVGYDYIDILHHYFPGISLARVK